jgi:hypothetical protein
MEWEILLGLAIAIMAIGVQSRLRRIKHRRSDSAAGNIYPLW